MPDNTDQVYSLADKLFFTNNGRLFLLEKVKYLYQNRLLSIEYEYIRKLSDRQLLVVNSTESISIISSDLKVKQLVNRGMRVTGITYDSEYLGFSNSDSTKIYDHNLNLILKGKSSDIKLGGSFYKIFSQANYLISIGYELNPRNYYLINPTIKISKQFLSDYSFQSVIDSGFLARTRISTDGGGVPENLSVSNFISKESQIYYLTFGNKKATDYSGEGLFFNVLNHEKLTIEPLKITDSLFFSQVPGDRQRIATLIENKNRIYTFSNNDPMPLAYFDLEKKQMVKLGIYTKNYVESIQQKETSFLVKEGKSIVEYDLSSFDKKRILDDSISTKSIYQDFSETQKEPEQTDKMLFGLQIFPNPTENSFKVSVSNFNNSFFIDIIDEKGNFIKTQEILYNGMSVEIDSLPSGVYYIVNHNNQNAN
ncbi:MAG: T9SS type A sorting domain-containing protein [Cytophagaceae bacterium]|nr:T9SS type A sorting domain-containing protein [Cytophagaceae bacterium]